MARFDEYTPRMTEDTVAPDLERFSYRAQREFTYRQTPQADLEITVHFPFDHTTRDRRPGALFFFGGGFVSGTRRQFTRQCVLLASLGMVAATADYRVRGYHGTSLWECIDDAAEAMRWFRSNSAKLGIDPDRIVVGGGSAGGTLAAILGVLPRSDMYGNDRSAEIRPNALALFNPALGSHTQDIATRLGMTEQDMRVFELEAAIGGGYPPAWIWFGSDDPIYERSKPMVERMIRDCPMVELVIEPGADHGYFNDFEPCFRSSLDSLKEFLQTIGYLE